MSKELKLTVAFAAIDKLSGSIKRIAQGSGAMTKELQAAQRELLGLKKVEAGLSGFRQLKRGLDQTETKLKEQQRTVAALAREMNAAGAPTAKLRREFEAAKKSAARTRQEFEQQRLKLEQLRRGLTGAGYSTRDLASSERRLREDMEKANRTIAEQERRAQRIQRLHGTLQKATGAGILMSGAVTAPLIALGKESIQASIEGAAALGQVTAGLESMGNRSGRSLEQLKAQAQGLMRTSLFDDDVILRDVTAQLLTFGNVSGAVFDRAQQAVVDFSARLGQDPKTGAIMLGKALNDPIKGITALSRAGVSFSAEQKELIKNLVKTGHAAQAQDLILKELEKQYGGSALAARKADPMAAAGIDFGEFQQTIGDQLVPMLKPLTEALTTLLNAFNSLSPGTQKFIVIAGLLAAALGPVLLVIGALAGPLATLGGLLLGLSAPVMGVVVALGVAAYLIYAHWDKIKAAFSAGVALVKNLLGALPGWLRSIGAAMMQGLLMALNPALLAQRLISIAKAGINAFKNFFGIKSPSRLFMQMGGHITSGLTLGIDRGRRSALGAMGRLATGVAAVGSMALSPAGASAMPARAPASSPAGAAQAGAGLTVNIYINQQPGQDARQLALEVRRELEALDRVRARSSYRDDA